MPTPHRGYLLVAGPQGVERERDTATCGHCQHVMQLPPPKDGRIIVRVDPPCNGCGKFICSECRGKGCDPWEEQMRRQEARFRLRQQILGRCVGLVLALLPALAGGQTATTITTTDTIQSGCSLGALNATCVVSMRGKSSVGFLVTAVSSPTGITLVAEASRDGTNWDGHDFVDADNGDPWPAIPNTSIAVGLTKSFLTGAGVRFARIRASAWTSGSATVVVTATDTILPFVFVEQRNSRRATYVACSAALANTASSTAIVCESGSTKTTRVRAVWVSNPGSQTSAAIRIQTLRRTTSASSGGTAVTPTPVDTHAVTGDAAYSGVCRTKPTAGGTGTTFLTVPLWVPTTVANLANPVPLWPPFAMTGGSTGFKDLVIPVGTANGIEVNDAGASGGANYYVCMLLTEE
jgi:hypothetical protein